MSRLDLLTKLRAPIVRGCGYHVLVTRLTPDQVGSLAVALSTAAVAVEADVARGRLCVPRRGNWVFRHTDLVSVVHEWLDEDGRRSASLTVGGRATNGPAPKEAAATESERVEAQAQRAA
jgi:hypothetical protein